jgi:hypothetical protein
MTPMKKSWILLVSLIWFLYGCGDNLKKENESLKEEVIAIHDEVMPLMGDLKNYQKQVEKRISQADSLGMSPEEIADLQVMAGDLGNSFEGMFVWMRQFKSSYDDMTDEQMRDYLLEQKVLVEKVNADIKKSMDSYKAKFGEK